VTARMGTSRGTTSRALATATKLGLTLLFLLIVWEAWVSVAGVSSLILPSPGVVLADLAANPGLYAYYSLRTIGSAAAGLSLGMVGGFLLAVVAWFSPLLSGVFKPSIIMLRSVPLVVVVPLIASLIGYSESAVIVAACVLSLFPAFVFCSSGMQAFPPGSRDLLQVMGAGRKQLFLRLAFPSAIPNLLTALRLTVAISIVAATIGEYLLGIDGLGWLFARSVMVQQSRAWGAAILIIALSVAAYAAGTRIEERGRARWAP
jgi:putative hydroxymethylpyrimidine transport system permease protein